jgi:hypothetical protein
MSSMESLKSPWARYWLSFQPDIPQQGFLPMHLFGAFELEIRPGTPDNPASVRIALLRYTRGEDGRLLVTPECSSFEEIEGQINSLQDEIRERACRAFQVA